MNTFESPEQAPKWIDSLFYVSIALLVAVIFAYGLFLAKIYLGNKTLDAINAQIAASTTSQEKDLERQAFNYKKKIDDFYRLVSNHRVASPVFGAIEAYTLPNVWFSGFTMSQVSNELILAGEAQNMETLSRQFQIFENHPEHIAKISVLNSEVLPEGKIRFALNIFLNPNIFRYQ